MIFKNIQINHNLLKASTDPGIATFPSFNTPVMSGRIPRIGFSNQVDILS